MSSCTCDFNENEWQNQLGVTKLLHLNVHHILLIGLAPRLSSFHLWRACTIIFVGVIIYFCVEPLIALNETLQYTIKLYIEDELVDFYAYNSTIVGNLHIIFVHFWLAFQYICRYLAVFFFFCCCCCLFFETEFLCSFRSCPGTSSVDQAGLELTDVCLPLPPKCWD